MLTALCGVAQVTANFTASPTSGCAPLAVNFTNTSTGATSYLWDFHNGQPQITTTSIAPVSSTFLNPGTFNVTLTASNGSATNVKTVTITVYGAPNVSFSASPTVICLGQPITFTDQSILNSPGAATYQWNFGNGQSGTGSPITYTYPTANTYNVTLTVINSAGCIANTQFTNYIHVNAPPAAGFSASTSTTCTNSRISFFNATTSTSTSFNSTWNFGDNSPLSNASNPTHSYTTPGTYSVSLKVVDASGCSDSITYTNMITIVTGTAASFTGPSAICQGQTATFTNTSTPGFTSCSWDFGDNSTGYGSPVSHTYSVAGSYQVKLGSTNNNCSDTTVHTLTVNPPPSVNMSWTPHLPCPAPATVNFSTTTGGTSYYWDFGDGYSSTSQNPSHPYSHNDTFLVSLVVTSAQGCIDTLTDSLFIYPLDLFVSDSSGNPCVPFPVHFADTPYYPVNIGWAAYPSPTVTWNWDFGDGYSSNSSNPYHTYTTYGNYNIKLTITTANGCTATDSVALHAGSPDTADFSAAPLVDCIKEPIVFTNLSHGATNYLWIFGDGGAANTTAPNPTQTYSYQSPGTFNVTLVAYKNGCSDTMTKTAYVTIHPPQSIIHFHYNCAIYNQVTLIDTSIGATSFKWDFGDGTKDSTSTTAIHNFPGPGVYTVILFTSNSVYGCTDSSKLVVHISHPVAVISTPDTAVCKNSPITLTGSLTGTNVVAPSPFAFTWYLNPTYFDTLAVRTHTYTTIGQKPVMLVINDYRACKDTAYKTLLVAWPTVNFTASQTDICKQTPVTFTDQSTDVVTSSFSSRYWNFGDGSYLPGNNSTPVHNYNIPGSYNVTLTVTDNVGCKDSLTKQAYINVHNPLSGFTTPNLTVCKKSIIPFFNLSQGNTLTYNWYFGDNGTSTLFQPTHAYMTPGTYTVALTVTDNIGCKDSFAIPNYLTVVDDPYASFNLTDTFSICSPLADTFTNTSVGGTSFAWSFGDGNYSAFQNAINIYSNPGVFNVLLIATNNTGCKDTARARVNVLGYAGLMTYTPLSGCAPLTVTYVAHVTGVPSFVYDFSDGNTLASSSDTVTHTYLVPGAYIPRIILNSNQGCQSSSVGTDLIKVDGVYAGFNYQPYPACGSDTIHFIDTSHAAFSSIISRKWIFHDATTSTLPNPFHYYGPGTYSITMIETTSSGCIDSYKTTLSVFNIPVISAGLDTVVCLGDSALLSGSGGVSYTWSPTPGLSCATCGNTYVAPTVPTQYIVIGTDANGCSNTDTVLVSLKTKTAGSADSSGEICKLASIQLHAHAFDNGATYTWIPPDGLDDSHSANPIASPGSSTKYMVIIKEGSCIPDTLFDNIIVHPIPTINTGPNQTIIAGDSYTIVTSGSNIVRYLWTPDTYPSCDTCTDPTSTPSKSTLYKIFVTSDFGCKDSSQILIEVKCDQSQVFIPNTFTPNGDGANDNFYPHGKGLQIIKSFRIYDRWGEMVYEKQNIYLNDKSIAWDGTFKGTKLTPDVYVYVVDAICETGAPITWTGDVALIR